MAPHPSHVANALKMNQKKALKRLNQKLAGAAGAALSVKDPVTGKHVCFRSPLTLREDGRISLSFSFFTGFGGTALGSEAAGSICGAFFDNNEEALRVLEGNLAPPPTFKKRTLVRAFETFDLLPGLARPGTSVRTTADPSNVSSKTELLAARKQAIDLRAMADAELEKVHDAITRNGIVEAEAKDSTRPTTEAGRALRVARNAEKRLNMLPWSKPQRRKGMPRGDSSPASNSSSTPIDDRPHDVRVDEVATRICNAIRGVLKSLGLKSEFKTASVDVRDVGINVQLADDFDIYLQFSPPCQEASNNNPNGDREHTKAVLSFLVDVEARIRTKIPITGTWYEMVNGHEIGKWMESGQRRLSTVGDGENGCEEEPLIDLQALMVSSQDGCTTAQRRERMLWVSGNRRRGASAERVKRDIRRLTVLGRVVPVSTVLGLDPKEYEYVDNRRPGPEKKEKRKPLDNLQGYTMTSNPPSIRKKGSEEIHQLSAAQVLALQGFDPRAFYVPKDMSQAHCLVGFANMVPLQLSILVWRALIYGVQEMIVPRVDDQCRPVYKKVFINPSRETQAEKNLRSHETKEFLTWAENMGTKPVRIDGQRVWYEDQKPKTPPLARTWRQIPLDPYAVMRAKDQMNPVDVGCDARTLEGTVVPGGYFCRLRSARADDSFLAEDLPCLSGWCTNRASTLCEEEGVYFCDYHFAAARDEVNRDYRIGQHKKREHQHCTLCGGKEQFQERAPGLSNIMNDERNRAMALMDMHPCGDKKCHRSICMTCLFTRWVNATCLRSDRSGFICHVHERGEEFARKADGFHQKRTSRLDRIAKREERKRLAASPRRDARSTKRVKREEEEKGRGETDKVL